MAKAKGVDVIVGHGKDGCLNVTLGLRSTIVISELQITAGCNWKYPYRLVGISGAVLALSHAEAQHVASEYFRLTTHD